MALRYLFFRFSESYHFKLTTPCQSNSIFFKRRGIINPTQTRTLELQIDYLESQLPFHKGALTRGTN